VDRGGRACIRIERGKEKQNLPDQSPAGFEFFAWWRRSQSIRTKGELLFEVALDDHPEPPIYQKIADTTLHLKQLRMNPNRIAAALKVDRTTVVRALRWIKGKPKYPARGHKVP
jgi:hypothetical protein